MTNNAKQAILDALIGTCKADLGSNAKMFAEAYATLCTSERDEKALDHYLSQKTPFETLKQIKDSIVREEIDEMFKDSEE